MLQFADDTILFLCYSEEVSRRVHRCLTIFTILSCLSINLQKNTIMSVWRDSSNALHIIEEFQCRSGTLSITYLALSLCGMMLDYKSWDHIVDMFRFRLAQ